MRILIVHNHYGDYAIGGEANVMKAEAELLRSHGHDVLVYERTNSEIYRGSIWGKISAFKNMTWSPKGYYSVACEIEKFKPDVMHVHNYKFVLSPSIFKAAQDRGIATVHTLHNYWLCAPCASLERNGIICEKCLTTGNPSYIIIHRCRKEGNLFFSLLNYIYFRSIQKRRKLSNYIDTYVALTTFARKIFVKAGLPDNKIQVKSNFLLDPLHNSLLGSDGGYAIFVGRLSFEKGVHRLLEAWQDIDYPLRIVGDGPLLASLRQKAVPQIQFMGALTHEDTLSQLKHASLLVFPSVWYEGMPLSLIEAMALAKPVVASDLGARREMVREGYNGFLYPPNDTSVLREKVHMLIQNCDLRKSMGKNAREFYLANYTPDRNYNQLMHIYETAIKQSRLRN